MTTTTLAPPRRARFSLPRGKRAWRAFAIQAAVLVLIVAFLAWVAVERRHQHHAAQHQHRLLVPRAPGRL